MAKAIDEFTITLSQMWQLFTICASTLLSIGDKYRIMINIPITFLFWTSNIFCFRQCEYICISSFFIKLSLMLTSHVKNRLTSYSFETAPSDVKCIEIIVVCDISFIIQQTKHQFA